LSNTLTYNGVTFEYFRKSVQVVPRITADKTKTPTITVNVAVQGWMPVDVTQNVHDIKSTLAVPAKPLIMTQAGLQWLTVGSSDDVAGGPMPHGVQVEAFENNAARIRWACTTEIPRPGTFLGGPLIELAYSETHEIDKHFTDHRTVSGVARYKTLDADIYREDLASYFPVPNKYERVSQRFSRDATKRLLSFNITDVQQHVNHPAGIKLEGLQHTITMARNSGYMPLHVLQGRMHGNVGVDKARLFLTAIALMDYYGPKDYIMESMTLRDYPLMNAVDFRFVQLSLLDTAKFREVARPLEWYLLFQTFGFTLAPIDWSVDDHTGRLALPPGSVYKDKGTGTSPYPVLTTTLLPAQKQKTTQTQMPKVKVKAKEPPTAVTTDGGIIHTMPVAVYKIEFTIHASDVKALAQYRDLTTSEALAAFAREAMRRWRSRRDDVESTVHQVDLWANLTDITTEGKTYIVFHLNIHVDLVNFKYDPAILAGALEYAMQGLYEPDMCQLWMLMADDFFKSVTRA
jgi:hypothetical protein